MFTLIIEDKQGQVVDEYSFEDGEFIVGRSHQADIVLQSDNVSRRHARLFTQDGRCFVEDLKAANGIWLNGKRVYNVTELPKSSQLRIGDFFLHLEGASHSRTMSAVTWARLIPLQSHIGAQTDLTQPTALVGRGKDCGIVLPDVSVSRIHAKFARHADGRVTLEDLRSSNGTFVNDRKIDQVDLQHGDRVRFGTVAFAYQVEGGPALDLPQLPSAPVVPGMWSGAPAVPRGAVTSADAPMPSALLTPPKSVLPQIALVAVIAVAAVCLIVLVGIAYDKWIAPKMTGQVPATPTTPSPEVPADAAPAAPAQGVDRPQFDALMTRGQDAIARRQWDEAQDLFEKARKVDPVQVRATEALNLINKEKRHGARFAQAEAAFARKDYEGAIQANKSIAQDSVYRTDANAALEAIAGLLEMDGDRACAAKDWTRCQNLYLTAISTDLAKPEVQVKYAKAMKKHH